MMLAYCRPWVCRRWCWRRLHTRGVANGTLAETGKENEKFVEIAHTDHFLAQHEVLRWLADLGHVACLSENEGFSRWRLSAKGTALLEMHDAMCAPTRLFCTPARVPSRLGAHKPSS